MKDMSGAAADMSGAAIDKASAAIDMSSAEKDMSGAVIDMSTVAIDMSGAAADMSGVTKDMSAIALDMSGAAIDKVIAAKKRVSAALPHLAPPILWLNAAYYRTMKIMRHPARTVVKPIAPIVDTNHRSVMVFQLPNHVSPPPMTGAERQRLFRARHPGYHKRYYKPSWTPEEARRDQAALMAKAQAEKAAKSGPMPPCAPADAIDPAERNAPAGAIPGTISAGLVPAIIREKAA